MEKSSEYRRFFINAFSIGVGDNEALLRIGFHQPPAPPDQMSVEADIVLTHKTLKLIAHNLMAIITAWEKHNGTIQIDVSQMTEAISRQMEEAMQRSTDSKKDKPAITAPSS